MAHGLKPIFEHSGCSSVEDMSLLISVVGSHPGAPGSGTGRQPVSCQCQAQSTLLGCTVQYSPRVYCAILSQGALCNTFLECIQTVIPSQRISNKHLFVCVYLDRLGCTVPYSSRVHSAILSQGAVRILSSSRTIIYNLAIFPVQAQYNVHWAPQAQVGFCGNERNPSLLVRETEIMTLYGKAMGVSMVNGVPWDLPRHSIHHDTPSTFQNNVLILSQGALCNTLQGCNVQYLHNCYLKKPY